jgi:folate-binding protein YgfZ
MDYMVNTRPYRAIQPLTDELTFLPQQNYLFELDYLTALQVEGEQAASFLQGQLSCDLRVVNEHQMRQGALCNLKGRIMALVDVLLWQDWGHYLVLPCDLAVATQATLAKPAQLSRVKVQQVPTLRVLGLYLQNRERGALTLPSEIHEVLCDRQFLCYRIDAHCALMVVWQDAVPQWIDRFKSMGNLRGSLAWHVLQMQRQRVEIYPQSRGLFLPHHLDLHRSGVLNFDKGCYKGQEIIARMHYRAKLKHHLTVLTVESPTTELRSGMVLYDGEGGTTVGELIDYCPTAAGRYLVALSVLTGYSGSLWLEGAGALPVIPPF